MLALFWPQRWSSCEVFTLSCSRLNEVRLADEPGRWDSKARHGWTKLDMFRLRGKHWGNLEYRSKVYGTHNIVHIVAGLGRETWDRQNKKSLKIESFNIPASFGTKKYAFQKPTNTKMTALARSIDLQAGWTELNWKIDSNRRIG